MRAVELTSFPPYIGNSYSWGSPLLFLLLLLREGGAVVLLLCGVLLCADKKKNDLPACRLVGWRDACVPALLCPVRRRMGRRAGNCLGLVSEERQGNPWTPLVS